MKITEIMSNSEFNEPMDLLKEVKEKPLIIHIESKEGPDVYRAWIACDFNQPNTYALAPLYAPFAIELSEDAVYAMLGMLCISNAYNFKYTVGHFTKKKDYGYDYGYDFLPLSEVDKPSW